tara:strand:- start:388 stop:828 length:441 start_codon:yes stop_codon:yes gene_type:complete
VVLPSPHLFDPLPPEREKLWMRYGRGDKKLFVNLVGLSISDVRLGYCKIDLKFRSELLQAGGFVHGGLIATLMDTACVPAVGSDFTGRRAYSTIDAHIQYQSSTKDEDLETVSWVTRRTKSIVFCESIVASASGRTLAKGAFTFKI